MDVYEFSHARYSVARDGLHVATFARVADVYSYARAALKAGEVMDVERIEESGNYLVFTLRRTADGGLHRSDV